jgi:hypothetical protein
MKTIHYHNNETIELTAKERENLRLELQARADAKSMRIKRQQFNDTIEICSSCNIDSSDFPNAVKELVSLTGFSSKQVIGIYFNK